MPTPWRRRLGRFALTIVVVVTVLAAIWWLWSPLFMQWDIRTVGAIVVVALVSLAAISWLFWQLWWRLPQRQVRGLDIQIHEPKARADTEDNFRKTVGQALGGAVVLIGAGAAYLQFTQQQQASHDLLISNQVSKGFEQLAGKETAMRLGGIYALEGVMNAPSSQYRVPVLEALCAFVRDSTTRHQVTLTTFLEALRPEARDKTVGKGNDAPATDIQAALTVIGRRNPGPGPVNLAGANIPGAALSEAHLEGASLYGVHLEGANLSGAHLERASLDGAHLAGALLYGVHLAGASLSGAHLERARLDGAHLAGANLGGAHLEGASLGEAYLERAFLVGAHLEGVRLGGAHLAGALLYEAHLEGAYLVGAHLDGANLAGAHLEVASLDGAHLEGASLNGAHLEGASLDGAHLEGAILTSAGGLTQEQIDRALGDAETKLPEGLTRPAHWGVPAGGEAAPAKP